ncbi:DUF4435 domain-containing protein [Aliivibrio fischeri]|uniref:DUF4435 domain-containing protein n=1 Tax=Aliivibrio fischeri TaxID=668 RepID=UPI0012DAB2B8|nr:DUF4435 domain-containing protein [Aliivibrio fischeri]MUK42438.1 DUF4435 domain-containing protein [Aliivibrio fischeri]
MSRVDVLKSSRDSVSVKFMEFTRIVSKNENRVALFFEGEDEKYFSGRINNIRPDIVWSGVNSKGKSNVIKLRNKIRCHAVYKNSPCLFFVDHDFDSNVDICNFTDVYITPCYSIENFYISNSTFERVLTAEFGLSDATEEYKCYQKAIDIFKDTKNKYLEAIAPFNFLIKEIRDKEEKGEIEGNLNINNLVIDDLVSINIGSVKKKFNESVPNSIFPELPSDLAISLSDSEEYFKGRCSEKWFRGKQHLEFFRSFLIKLKEDRGNKAVRKIFNKKGKVKLNLTKANSISELSQYADTPNCLKQFLEHQEFL